MVVSSKSSLSNTVGKQRTEVCTHVKDVVGDATFDAVVNLHAVCRRWALHDTLFDDAADASRVLQSASLAQLRG